MINALAPHRLSPHGENVRNTSRSIVTSFNAHAHFCPEQPLPVHRQSPFAEPNTSCFRGFSNGFTPSHSYLTTTLHVMVFVAASSKRYVSPNTSAAHAIGCILVLLAYVSSLPSSHTLAHRSPPIREMDIQLHSAPQYPKKPVQVFLRLSWENVLQDKHLHTRHSSLSKASHGT